VSAWPRVSALPGGGRRAISPPVTPTPESILVDKLRALDAAIAAGRASPDIARREVVRDGGIVHTEISFDTRDSALRELLGRLLVRHRIPLVRRKRQRATMIVFAAPSVFVDECLGAELGKLPVILDEFFVACVHRAVGDLFREPNTSATSTRAVDDDVDDA
jgi:hypothetical protein